MQAIVDHHHAETKTASKVRFAEPGGGAPEGSPVANHRDHDAPSPPLSDNEDKDKDDKVIKHFILINVIMTQMHIFQFKWVEFLIYLSNIS